ncbi:MAG: aldo/keto reductase, partial [Prevotella sp.]|nr:aldo/keto reductase [Prevotella sp.]
MKNFRLNNGTEIPAIGLGTWQTPDGETAVKAVSHAIKCGYRHVDAAAVYDNEQSVGEGIRKGLQEAGLKREQLFVTSKVWNTERGYDRTMRAFEKTLGDLGLDYLDLYLIHWPANAKQFADWQRLNAETWRAMEELYKAERIRSIGVSNFYAHHLEALMQSAEVMPMVNQIEFHPGFMQR